MNTDKLNEMADYLDKGDFDGKSFSMGAYQDCVLGHCAARELKRKGLPISAIRIDNEVHGIAFRVFGIRQSVSYDDWSFVFGAMWGDDHRAAADRLRYLARHGGAPDKSVWAKYRTHPQPVVEAPADARELELAAL